MSIFVLFRLVLYNILINIYQLKKNKKKNNFNKLLPTYIIIKIKNKTNMILIKIKFY